MKEYIKQIIDIIKANGLTGIQIDLVRNTISEQRSIDDDQLIDTSDPAMQEAFTESPYLSRKEAAEMLRCSTDTVDNLIADGKLKSGKLSSARCGRVLIDRKSVMEVISRRCPVKINEEFDINQAISDIRKDNPEIQQEDVEAVDENVPEGYYSIGQVRALTGLHYTVASTYMRQNNVRVVRASRKTVFYNKEDVDNYIAKQNSVSSYVAIPELAKSLGISSKAIGRYILRNDIKAVHVGRTNYVTKEAVSKIRESYRYENDYTYISASEIQKLLGGSMNAVRTFVKRYNISNTGCRVLADNCSMMLYNRADVMKAFATDRKNKDRSLGKYDTTIMQLKDIYGCSWSYARTLLADLNIRPNRRVANRTGAICLNIYDIRDILEAFKRNNYSYHMNVMQCELERREAL